MKAAVRCLPCMHTHQAWLSLLMMATDPPTQGPTLDRFLIVAYKHPVPAPSISNLSPQKSTFPGELPGTRQVPERSFSN